MVLSDLYLLQCYRYPRGRMSAFQIHRAENADVLRKLAGRLLSRCQVWAGEV